MDRRPTVARRFAPSLLASLLVVSGCATQSGPAAATPAATSSPPPAPGPRPPGASQPNGSDSGGDAGGGAGATAIPWPGLAISGTSAGDTITGTLVTLDDPSVSLRMPTNWQAHTTSEVRSYVVSVLDLVPARYQGYYKQFLARIDAGDFRFFMSGPSGTDGVTATITVEVGPPHDGQPDAVAELKTESQELGTPHDIQQVPWRTVLGPGIVATGVLDPPADIPSVTTRTVLLVVPLPDGRMWALRGTGPESSTTFVGTVGDVMRSIARPYFASSPAPSPVTVPVGSSSPSAGA